MLKSDDRAMGASRGRPERPAGARRARQDQDKPHELLGEHEGASRGEQKGRAGRWTPPWPRVA